MDLLASSNSDYIGREQSLVKHMVLQKYLERFAFIVGSRWNSITYVDGFSGPWNVKSDECKDSSFAIALNQLRRARDTLRATQNRDFKIRCLFLETDKSAFEKLATFAASQTDADVRTINADFEHSIDAIIRFINEVSNSNFPFVFIDPRGWTGFSMNLIAPLLRLQPCEVLINFMTSHIIRFIEAENIGIEASFERLFGDAAFREAFAGLTGEAREDAVVLAYAERVGSVGGYSYTPVTIVPHPEKDRSHFHLVYATRTLKGVEVFKESERNAITITEQVRADAKRRKREQASGQHEMFTGSALPESGYTDALRIRYGSLARAKVMALLQPGVQVPYDNLYAAALSYPLVTQTDLRDWISDARGQVIGLGQRERVPKPGSNHAVIIPTT